MATYDTNMLMLVNSSRMGGLYECHRFKEYRVDIDLETDTDGFDFVFQNPHGYYTSLFSRFDPVDIYINGHPCVTGRIDSVEYEWDDTDSFIHITGRDIAAVLVDNDALPCTKMNVNPIAYINEKCAEYGIKKVKSTVDMSVVDKLIIGTGETEISVMNNMIVDNQKRMWLIYDQLFIGEWSTDGEVDYYFSRGMPREYSGIPIKTLKLLEDGTPMHSEVIIYGSSDNGSNKVIGTAKNDYMINKGIKKRSVQRSYNNDSSSKYASNALKKIRDSFNDNIILEITIKTGKQIIMPNTIARVADSVTKINSTFFIKSVSYSKSSTRGSITKIQMIPSDKTFDIIWKGQGTKATGGVTSSPSTTTQQLASSVSLSELKQLREKGLI